MRAENLEEVIDSIHNDELGFDLHDTILAQKTKNTTKVRIHESGDFFCKEYLQGWIECAKLLPDLKFYCYSKSLHLFLNDDLDADIIDLPSNFYLTASYGGKWDHLIDRVTSPATLRSSNLKRRRSQKGWKWITMTPTACRMDPSPCWSTALNLRVLSGVLRSVTAGRQSSSPDTLTDH